MYERAFFFQGDSLLLPLDADLSQAVLGVPLDRAEDYDTAEIFEIPELENPNVVIRVVSIPPQEPCENCKAIPVRQVLTMFATGTIAGDPADLSALIRAFHIVQWRHTSRFCGTCGTENCDASVNTAAEDIKHLLATPFPYPPPPMPQTVQPSPYRVCPNCGRQEYPRICPAIIVIITDEQDRILLAHNKRFKDGVYSHIAGFNEAGESLEETVVREVREEVNIEIKDIEYVKSQPWPFPNSLMIGFRARYASGAVCPDGEEITDARWFTKDNLRQGLPELPGEGSLSRWLINEWLNAPFAVSP